VSDITTFAIEYRQFLDQDGRIVAPLPGFAQDPETLVALYRALVLTRLFDTRAIALQRTGKLGTYASSLGQEAVSVGIGHAMAPEDVLVPMYRDYGAQLQRGVRISELLLYWGGDERGMCFSGPTEDFPISVPVASHAPHAVGIAYAFRYRKEPRVAVCVVGDGATSKGDFYEAINAAGVWSLPVIFVVNNNQWAISVPRKLQSSAETLAQKAFAAGFKGEQVDGNDVIAVRERMTRALEKARSQGGPTLIEALTYRMCDHTTADDATRYRTQAELQRYARHDPIARLKEYLLQTGSLSEERDRGIHSACEEAIEKEVARYLDMPPQPPQSMFDHLYAVLPEQLVAQRAAVATD
jgi:pyruvate dehydrogenase E1 component alpha subunit